MSRRRAEDRRETRPAARRASWTALLAGTAARRASWTALLAGCLLASGCSSKKEDPDAGMTVPLRQGSASSEGLLTGVGFARPLDATLAPSAVEWTRIIVLDEKRALLAGQVTGQTVAIRTDDAGRTWRSLQAEPGGWATWSAGADGTAVLATGDSERVKLAPGQKARVDSVRLGFGASDAPSLNALAELIPQAGKGRPRVLAGGGIAAVLSPSSAALFVETGPRKQSILYGGLLGSEPPPPTPMPPAESVVAIPYGRPPSVLSMSGRNLLVRDVPPPGAPLPAPFTAPKVAASPALLAELAQPPACEAGPWTFQRVTQAGGPVLLGVSPGKVAVIPMPRTAVKGSLIGCTPERVLIQTLAPKETSESLVTCGLDGACTQPENQPFRPWSVPHERTLFAVPTSRGAVAVMSARAGERWGLYLSQSLDGGKLYELQRVVGEGDGDRGRLELRALVSFGARVLLVLSTDVTGTSRKGFYVTASDDGGTTWNPP